MARDRPSRYELGECAMTRDNPSRYGFGECAMARDRPDRRNRDREGSPTRRMRDEEGQALALRTQEWLQSAARGVHIDAAAFGIICHLVFPDSTDAKIPRLRVRVIPATDRCRRVHRQILG